MDALDPAFSPNGRLLAVQWDDPPGGGIVLIAPNGRPVRRLTRNTDRSPTWAPSGTRLAFDRQRCRAEATCKSLGIYTVAAKGSRPRRIVASGVAPAWSARNEIAFVADGDLLQFDDSQGPIRVTDPAMRRTRTLTSQGYSLDSPVWSPDDQRIAFLHGDELQTITPAGRARRTVREIQYEYEGSLSRVEHLDWQPLR